MKCKVCGKEMSFSGFREPICSDECFIRDFWNEALDESAIIIDGTCYHDGGAKPKGRDDYLGFGGRQFTIEKTDGTVIITNNLWFNGKIPEEFKTEDNARFIGYGR